MSNSEIQQVLSEANAFFVAEQYPQAIKLLGDLLLTHPNNADALFLRGKANTCWLSFSDAEDDFRAAIKIQPDRTEYYLELGHLYLEQEMIDKAATEFSRAEHLSPQDVDVQFALLKIQISNGEYDQAIPKLVELQLKHKSNVAIIDLLVDGYHHKALENWYKDNTGKQETFCALSKEHVGQAEVNLRKIEALSPQTAYSKLMQDDLFEIIKVAKTRNFNGGVFSWLIPGILVIMGFSSSSFWGMVYAISAATYFFANRRPVYVTNNLIHAKQDDISPIDRVINFIDGDWIVFSSSISGVIFQKAKIALTMQAARAILTGLFMPITVFSALRKNYSFKYAAVFIVVAGLGGVAVDATNSYQLGKNRNYIASLHEVINNNDYQEFKTLESEYPKLALRSRSAILLSTIRNDNPKAFDFLISHYKITVNQRQGQSYFNYAQQNKATKMVEHLDHYNTIQTKATASHAINSNQNRIENSSQTLPKSLFLNHSFEEDNLGSAGWKFGVHNWNGNRHGVVLPPVTMFPSGKTPQGRQMAFLSKAGSWMEQTLSIKPKIGLRYQLAFKAGLRLEPDFSPGNYEVQIFLDSNLIVSKKYSTPNKGEFEQNDLFFSLDKTAPENSLFRIKLLNLDANQINFDDIRFFTTEQSLDTKQGKPVVTTQSLQTETATIETSTRLEATRKKPVFSPPDQKKPFEEIVNQKILGCWNWSNGGYIIITSDGIAQIKGFWSGRWQIDSNNPSKYIITWPPFLDTIKLNSEGTNYSGKNAFNFPLSGKRVGQPNHTLLGSWIREDGVELNIKNDGTVTAAQFRGNWKKIDDTSYQIQWHIVDEITFTSSDEIQVKNQFGSVTASRDKTCSSKTHQNRSTNQ